jgi:branched-chain amino acid transport system ATP-binding protein
MTAMLEVADVWSGYGDATVLRGVSLEVAEHEIVAVVGANGAGKSTLLRTISGLITARQGTVRFAGEDITRRRADQIVDRGLIMVPEGGRLFPFMTVRENLELGAHNPTARPQMARGLDEVFEWFPVLAERRTQLAGSLSGGERSMCALARAVMSRPKLLMLDEPSLGLSPLMVKRVFGMIAELARTLSITIVLVEQNVNEALKLAARAYVVEQGRIVKSGDGATLLADPSVRRAYLGG